MQGRVGPGGNEFAPVVFPRSGRHYQSHVVQTLQLAELHLQMNAIFLLSWSMIMR